MHTLQTLPGNAIRLLESGTEYFPALIAEIDAAQEEIHLEAYIFEADATGLAVSAALMAAARRGVAVRVLVDGFGARAFEHGIGARLAAAGVEALTYRPEVGYVLFRRRRLRRLHRKLSTFDGRIAFVGGINVIDDTNTPHQTPPRFDYAVRIEGPLVGPIHQAVRHVWQLVRWSRLGRRPPPPPNLQTILISAGTQQAAFLVRDNLRHRRDIEDAYIAAINAAQREIIIANAYFLPGWQFRQALSRAARRGVKVTLLLQGRVEYALLHFATLSLYDNLLSTKIRIVEYRASFLHAKVAVVDDEWATVGSSNIDPFSLLLAREANVMVHDAGFANELHRRLQAAIDRGGVEIKRREIRQRGWLARQVGRLAYGIIRFMVSLTIYRAKGQR